MIQDKEVKRQLRALRKLKKQTQPLTDARRQINAQIRDAKEHLAKRDEVLLPDAEKQAMIDELTRVYRSKARPVYVDFRTYTIDQLGIHLEKVKRS